MSPRSASSVVDKLTYAVGRDPIVATDWDWFMAAALAVRDHVLERWMASTRTNYVSGGKRVYYLSLEFLIGRLLHDSLNNLGLVDRMRAALAELGVDYDRLRNIEHDAALGNGGLGRLAACFMESMATLCIAAHGYGIRYDHGMFRQVIQDGWQQEYPENWLTFGNPWEFARPDATHQIGFGGTCRDKAGGRRWRRALCLAPGGNGRRSRLRYAGGRLARPLCQHAAAVVRPGGRTRCGSMRSIAATMSARWRRAPGPTRFRRCSTRATRRRPARNCGCARNISSPPRRCRTWSGGTCASTWRHPHAADKAAIQLNDTHPAIAVAELMRILVDLHEMPWDEAWRDHHGHDRLHQPHAAARGAGKLAGVADGAAAAAPHADHLPDQPAASRRCLRAAACATARRSQSCR